MRVAILGGGIGGLSCAHYALNAGMQPVIFEAQDCYGALSSQFTHDGARLDCFHTPLLGSDSAVCGLIAELGLSNLLVWRRTETLAYLEGQRRPFATGGDLLRFELLSRRDRARAAFGTMWSARWRRYGVALDPVPASDWLRRLYGPRFFERLWEPLLIAKYGEYADLVPASLAWRLLSQHVGQQRAVRGYLRGGYAGLGRRLADSIEARGGQVRLKTPVAQVEAASNQIQLELVDGSQQTFDAVVSTLTLPDLAKIAGPELLARLPNSNLAYHGLVSAVVMTRAPLGAGHYATFCLDRSMPFSHAADAASVVPADCLGGYRPIYLWRRCAAHTRQYQAPDADVERDAIETLRTVYPTFDTSRVEAVRVFRASHVEPLWFVGAGDERPPVRIGTSRAYLCTVAQAYPRDPGSDTSVMLARETVQKLTRDAG